MTKIMTATVNYLCTALLILSATHGVAAAELPTDWPTFRHDWQLTGIFPVQGKFTVAPRIAWSIDLGATPAPSERPRIADLDGDGLPEILLNRHDRLVCMDRRGKTLWEAKDLPQTKITDIRPLAGTGANGILVWTDTGLEMTRWIISGITGKATKLYSMNDVFGTEERIGKILPDVQGEQLCAWWSGEIPGKQFTGNMHADGFIFSFENGIENPVKRFAQSMEGVLYKPKHLFADYDGDGRKEMIIVSHQQAWFFDIATNTLKLKLQWPMIRTYTATLALLPPENGAAASLFSINSHIPGVERIDIVNGEAKVAWRYIAGGVADQYQTQVKIASGAPDPYVRLGADGRLYALATITNEHGDGKPWFCVIDGVDGKKVHEESDVTVKCYDDLDGDGRLELLLQAGTDLRVANWVDGKFVDRWRGSGAEALLMPVPSEGDLGRSDGGNPAVWRVAPGDKRFLMRLSEGVYACTLELDGVKRCDVIPEHEALQNIPNPKPPEETVVREGDNVVVRRGNDIVFQYAVRTEISYLAPPALVADLGSERRVIVKDASDALVSFSAKGDDKKVLLTKSFGDPSVCDMDGNGSNELVSGFTDDTGKPACAIVDATGKVLRSFGLIENSTALRVGPSGSLGPGRGRWISVYYERAVGNRNGVVIYDGKTGEQHWLRDDFQSASAAYGEDKKVKFVMHIPTAIFDYDGDGADDILAASENFYGIVSVAKKQDITPLLVFSDYVPGHWQAYASPIAVSLTAKAAPSVFHHRAFSNAILTSIEGTPTWHWGLSRNATASSWPGFADFDGDGTREIVQTRVDGLLRAFDAAASGEKCPQCPPEQALTEMNHGGHVRWEKSFSPPVSDLASGDLDGDGKGEVIFGTGDGRLYSLGEIDGKPSIEWEYDFGRTTGSPILADVDNDNTIEILVPVEDGRLVCLKP
jgi:hypothetical protein